MSLPSWVYSIAISPWSWKLGDVSDSAMRRLLGRIMEPARRRRHPPRRPGRAAASANLEGIMGTWVRRDETGTEKGMEETYVEG
jgi:hypothetical protein